MEVAEDVRGEFFGDALFCGAVGGEDVVAFCFGEGFVEQDDVVEGFGHFYVAALGCGEDGLLEVGAGVGCCGLRFEIGFGDGIGVELGVVLHALGVTLDAFGGGGCCKATLTIQGVGRGGVEEF